MCGLKVRFTQSPDPRGVLAYSINVRVIEAKGIPPKIFVYHQSPAGIDGNTYATFDHIATPVDFHEIPEDSASEIVPWFRTDECTIWLRSVSDLKMAKQLFIDDILSLQRSYDLLSGNNNHINQTDVTFNSDGVHSAPVKEHEDMDDDIERLDKEVASKVSKDALDGLVIDGDSIDGIREAVVQIGGVLGATVPNMPNPDKEES